MSSSDHYDYRRRERLSERLSERRLSDRGDDEDHHNHKRDRRDRSRSRSPPSAAETKKARLEAERQARMARLRADNEQEEARSAALEDKAHEPVKPSAAEQIVQVNEDELLGLEDDEKMKLLLGFTGGFGTTKYQKVADNHQTHAAGGAAKNKGRKYRQYMNRKNGFNRPLDKMD